MSPLPSTAALIDALRALPPRALRFLENRHLERRALGESAAHFGITEEALCVHLLRAAQQLARDLDPDALRPDRPPSAQEELDDARALEAALTAAPRPARGLPPALAPEPPREAAEVGHLAALCRQLREAGPELTRGLREAERAELESPGGRMRERLRLAAIAALVLLTLWMSLR